MRLVFYDDFKQGLIADDGSIVPIGVTPLRPAHPQDALVELIAVFDEVRPVLERLESVGGGAPPSDVRLRPPVPRPGKIICARANYREDSDREPWPVDAFLKSPDAVIGPDDVVHLPRREHPVFHHEAELAVIIAKDGKDFSVDDAMDYVFGYTAFMDVSARGGIGRKDGASFLGKSYDTFAPLGPAVVTKDEVKDPQVLQVRYFVNEMPRHDYNTADMEHAIPELLAFLASVMTLKAGDVVACGTNHQQIGPLQHGDVARIEIEDVGGFTVSVEDPLRRSWPRVFDEEIASRVRRPPA